MAVGRISSFAVQQSLMKDVSRTQAELFGFQDQLSNGFKSRAFSGLAGSVELFTDLQAKVRKSERYIENIEVATTRLNTVNKSLDQTIKMAEDLKALMTQWRSSDKSNINLTQQVVQMREGMGAALNVTMEGRYLFGGTKTNVPPVDVDFPEPVAVGVPDTTYYQGSQDNIKFRAQETYEMELDVRADDESFQKIFAAARLALQADSEKSDLKMKQAMDMLDEGIQGNISLQTKTNVNILALKDIQERHKSTQVYFQGLSDGIVKTDIVEVSTKVAYHQATLQAAFQAFAKVNSLKLSDYLK